jgi:hypothetical protein
VAIPSFSYGDLVDGNLLTNRHPLLGLRTTRAGVFHGDIELSSIPW